MVRARPRRLLLYPTLRRIDNSSQGRGSTGSGGSTSARARLAWLTWEARSGRWPLCARGLRTRSLCARRRTGSRRAALLIQRDEDRLEIDIHRGFRWPIRPRADIEAILRVLARRRRRPQSLPQSAVFQASQRRRPSTAGGRCGGSASGRAGPRMRSRPAPDAGLAADQSRASQGQSGAVSCGCYGTSAVGRKRAQTGRISRKRCGIRPVLAEEEGFEPSSGPEARNGFETAKPSSLAPTRLRCAKRLRGVATGLPSRRIVRRASRRASRDHLTDVRDDHAFRATDAVAQTRGARLENPAKWAALHRRPLFQIPQLWRRTPKCVACRARGSARSCA